MQRIVDARFWLLACSFELLARAQVNGKEFAMEYPTFYRTKQIDGLSIFYREAGPKDAPTLLLLHGLPTSSRQFEPLLARLADQYHLVASDYLGFGQSDWSLGPLSNKRGAATDSRSGPLTQ